MDTVGTRIGNPSCRNLPARCDGQMWFYEAAPTSAVQKAHRLAAIGIDDRQ